MDYILLRANAIFPFVSVITWVARKAKKMACVKKKGCVWPESPWINRDGDGSQAAARKL